MGCGDKEVWLLNEKLTKSGFTYPLVNLPSRCYVFALVFVFVFINIIVRIIKSNFTSYLYKIGL